MPVPRPYRSGMFRSAFAKRRCLALDPDNPNFTVCLGDGTLRRQVAHEVHHCLRMGGPGYGRTLSEALVSEGLAGHFTRRLFDNPPEPWECAVDDEVLHAHRPDKETPSAKWYNHAEWFFGTGGRRPRPCQGASKGVQSGTCLDRARTDAVRVAADSFSSTIREYSAGEHWPRAIIRLRRAVVSQNANAVASSSRASSLVFGGYAPHRVRLF
jgi:hypothetical protein